MANGYIDILPRGLFSPYIGAGVGFVYHDITRTRFGREIEVDGLGVPTATAPLVWSNGSKENGAGLAAALMGGVTVSIDHRWALDLNYRAQYLAGTSLQMDIVNAGLPAQVSKGILGDHWEHQVRLGLRFNIW
jgi:opacity protein-like surface antigen